MSAVRRNYQKHTNPNPLHRWLLGRFHSCLATLIEEVGGDTPAAALLDVGCGEGFVVDYLRQRGFRAPVVGLDADPLALEMARRLEGELVEGSATALPFVDGAFPLVLSLEVLEHLTQPELALRELARVSSGHIVLSVPNQPFFSIANFLRGKNVQTLGEDPEHVHHWTAGQFLKLIGNVVRVERVVYSFPWVIARCRRI